MRLIIGLTLCAFASEICSKSLSKKKRQEENTESCVCVPYYQCPEEIEERRIRPSHDETKDCYGLVEVCCFHPDTDLYKLYKRHINTAEKSSQSNRSLDEVPSETRAKVKRATPEQSIIDDPTDESKESVIPLPLKPEGVSGCGVKREISLDFRFGSTATNTSAFELTEDSSFFGETPWMVAVSSEEKGENKFACGGSLITPSVVLTAASCVLGKKEDKIIVTAGEWDSSTTIEPLPHQERRIRKKVIHQNFKSQFNYDIALLFVDRPFDLSDNVDTICIDRVDFKTQNCFVTGWGGGKFSEKPLRGKPRGFLRPVLSKVDVPIVDRDTCQRKYRQSSLGKSFELHKGIICSGAGVNRDICTGDGGGPLVCSGGYSSPHKYSQVGIVSWGIGCGKEYPSLYTSVDYFYDWIQSHINS